MAPQGPSRPIKAARRLRHLAPLHNLSVTSLAAPLAALTERA